MAALRDCVDQDGYVLKSSDSSSEGGGGVHVDADGREIEHRPSHLRIRARAPQHKPPPPMGDAGAAAAAAASPHALVSPRPAQAAAQSHSSPGGPSCASTAASSPSAAAAAGGASSADQSASETGDDSGDLAVTSLSDLIVLNPIGQGASGLVQKVVHRLHPDLFLALKVVPLDLSESKSKAVLVELRTLHFAQHPNIVSFYGAFYKERSISIVLEHMDQGSLSDCIKRLRAAKMRRQKKRRERRIRKQQQMLLMQQQEQQTNGSSSAAAAVAAAAVPARPLPSPSSPILSSPLMSEAHISCVARQLLSGLHYLHTSRRLIHRDIKVRSGNACRCLPLRRLRPLCSLSCRC